MTPGMPFIDVSIGNVTSCLDFLRREAFGLGQDVDGRPVDVGKNVDGECSAARTMP